MKNYWMNLKIAVVAGRVFEQELKLSALTTSFSCFETRIARIAAIKLLLSAHLIQQKPLFCKEMNMNFKLHLALLASQVFNQNPMTDVCPGVVRDPFTGSVIKPPFEFDDATKDGFRGLLGAGFTRKEAAFECCKAHPMASKLSANERKRWQKELLEEV